MAQPATASQLQFVRPMIGSTAAKTFRYHSIHCIASSSVIRMLTSWYWTLSKKDSTSWFIQIKEIIQWKEWNVWIFLIQFIFCSPSHFSREVEFVDIQRTFPFLVICGPNSQPRQKYVTSYFDWNRLSWNLFSWWWTYKIRETNSKDKNKNIFFFIFSSFARRWLS